MKEISHDQAHRYILAAADDLLDDGQRAELRHHLLICESCRSESKYWDELAQARSPLAPK